MGSKANFQIVLKNNLSLRKKKIPIIKNPNFGQIKLVVAWYNLKNQTKGNLVAKINI